MATTSSTAPRRGRFGLREEWVTGYLTVFPTAAFFAVFIVFPVAYSLWLSFLNWDGMSPDQRFVGLRNYERMLEQPLFWRSMGQTGVFIVGLVPVRMAIALGLALLLNQKIGGLAFYRTLYFTPVVTSTVAVSIVWLWIFDPSWGVANWILESLGLPPSQWLSDPNTALPSLIAMTIWKTVGFEMVIYLAGLQGIPASLYEAAAIDGAGPFAKFFRITLPLLAPIVFFNLVLQTINAFKAFTPAFIVSAGTGGPIDSTLFYTLYLYQEAFGYFRMGYASAMAWVLLVVIGLFTALAFVTSRFWVYYGDEGR
jgi:multiple sugar transport system permease protein